MVYITMTLSSSRTTLGTTSAGGGAPGYLREHSERFSCFLDQDLPSANLGGYVDNEIRQVQGAGVGE